MLSLFPGPDCRIGETDGAGQVREFVLTAYANYKSKGYVPYSGKKQAAEEYGHPHMVRRFAQVLDSVVDQARPRKLSRTTPGLG